MHQISKIHHRRRHTALWTKCGTAVLSTLLSGALVPASIAQSVAVQPSAFPAVSKVDPRFLSYNVEMAEVVGARFWAPYAPPGTPQGDKYRQREPLDLRGNVRLRNMARALAPAYMRVSGTWANSTYFQDDDQPRPAEPPVGYKAVLTRSQWSGVVAFAKSVDAKIVTSFPISPGARNSDGTWNSEQTRRLFQYTRSIGGHIEAVEPINEPNLVERSALPKDYSPGDFARDNQAFKAFLEREAPDTKFAGPSGTADAGFFHFERPVNKIRTEAFLSASDMPKFDIFAYHFYTSTSERCMPGSMAAKPESGLTEEWLAQADRIHATYKTLHDRFAPETPIWVTEIGQASCGGDRWASTFADTFRFVDNAARLAKSGASAIFHNTLAASDYALIDDHTWEPRPNYWAAVLWHRLMGETVLDAGPQQEGFHVYAQCLRGRPGGVSLVAINLDQTNPKFLQLPISGQRYTLSADKLVTTVIKLNGRPLTMNGDHLPALKPITVRSGTVELAPATITFFALPTAGNPACTDSH